MPDSNSGGAANFFGDPDRAKEVQEYVEAREEALEVRAVKTLMKRFGIRNKAWDTNPDLRFGHFDEQYPGFPVRLSTERIVARNRGAEKRYIGSLAFHELKPHALFRPAEFKKTQVFKSWLREFEAPVLDRRPVGVVFPCVGLLFVIHDWPQWTRAEPGVRLDVRDDDHHLTVEQFAGFLDRVWGDGWRPD